MQNDTGDATNVDVGNDTFLKPRERNRHCVCCFLSPRDGKFITKTGKSKLLLSGCNVSSQSEHESSASRFRRDVALTASPYIGMTHSCHRSASIGTHPWDFNTSSTFVFPSFFQTVSDVSA